MKRNEYLEKALKYYDVLPDGRVRKNTTNSGRPAKTDYVASHVDKRGYRRVSLSVEGEKRTVPVHRLVAFKFHGPSSLTVDHIDGNKLNNHPDNLRYVSQEQNAREHFKLNEQPGRATISKSTVRAIRDDLKNDSASNVARKFKLPYDVVYNIHRGITWGWLK